MPEQKHIGFVIFGICSLMSARLAIFEPKPPPQQLSPAEERWGTHETDTGDPLGLIHGLRYYIYGLGIVGLLIVVEDHFNERSRKRKGTDEQPPPPKGNDEQKKPDV